MAGKNNTPEKPWTTKDHDRNAREKLVGRKITSVRYMTDKEAEDFGWHSKPLIIWLDDETYIIPMRDDEGNDGGSLQTHNMKTEESGGFPVLR